MIDEQSKKEIVNDSTINKPVGEFRLVQNEYEIDYNFENNETMN